MMSSALPILFVDKKVIPNVCSFAMTHPETAFIVASYKCSCNGLGRDVTSLLHSNLSLLKVMHNNR